MLTSEGQLLPAGDQVDTVLLTQVDVASKKMELVAKCRVGRRAW